MAALLEVVPYCPNPTDLFLALVIVDVEYRRHGLGKQLLQFVFDLAKKLKCTGYIKLLVEEWNNDSLSY
jgi:GNAT superfamily N-acetyltransferase